MNRRKNNHTFQYVLLGLIVVTGIILCAMLVAIGNEKSNISKTPTRTTKANETTKATAAIVNMPTTHVEMKEGVPAIVISVNKDAKMITAYLTEEYDNVALSVDETTYIYSMYGTAMTLGQLVPGDVIEVSYDAVSSVATLIRYPDDLKVVTHAEGVAFNPSNHTVNAYQSQYYYAEDMVIATQDRVLKLNELDAKDQLKLNIRDNKVISVQVEKGHGYLTLTGYDLFIGGFIDVGNYMIKVIEPDMMLVVKEGTYKVSVSHEGYVGTKTVEIERDKVSIVDFSEINPDKIEKGNVFFDVNVSDAVLYLNGEVTNYEEGILTLPVGDYSVKLTADGFENYTDSISVIADYQKFTIVMTPEETQSVEPATTVAATEAVTEPTTYVSAKNKVFIDEPEGAMIYFDTTYVGIAPVSFPMITGTHTIIVFDGSTVRSYNVNLADGADDVRYSFKE